MADDYNASQESAEAAIEAITSNTKHANTGKLSFLSLDLNDLISVKKAAATFAAQESKLDVLWNNAGVDVIAIPKDAKIDQGTDALLSAHCVAPLLLSKLLLPQLRAAVRASSPEKVRVVWSSSLLVEGTLPLDGVDLSALDESPKDPISTHTIIKIGNWFLASEWARRYGIGDEAMISVTENAGDLQTDTFKGASKLWMFFLSFLVHPPELKAFTKLFAGFSSEITMEKNGAFIISRGRTNEWYPRKIFIMRMKAEHEGAQGAARKFWDMCEQEHQGFDSQ